MDTTSTPAKDPSSKGARTVCFEMKPFTIPNRGTQVSFLDVWGDPPLQSIRTSGKASDKEYISAATKNRKGSGFRATLIDWGLILE